MVIWSEVQTCIRPSWCHCHSLSLASVKSRFVLPFYYRLTQIVPDKGPLNGCACVRVCGSLTRLLVLKLSLRFSKKYSDFWHQSVDANSVDLTTPLFIGSINYRKVSYLKVTLGLEMLCWDDELPVSVPVCLGLPVSRFVLVTDILPDTRDNQTTLLAKKQEVSNSHKEFRSTLSFWHIEMPSPFLLYNAIKTIVKIWCRFMEC